MKMMNYKNYTQPNDLNYVDKPEDWLNSTLTFAAALGHILKENEGVVVDIKGDMKFQLNKDAKKVMVFNKDGMIRVQECEEDLDAGALLWIH